MEEHRPHRRLTVPPVCGSARCFTALVDDRNFPAAVDECLQKPLDGAAAVRADRDLGGIDAAAVAERLELLAVGIGGGLPPVPDRLSELPVLLLGDSDCEVSCAVGVHWRRE